MSVIKKSMNRNMGEKRIRLRAKKFQAASTCSEWHRRECERIQCFTRAQMKKRRSFTATPPEAFNYLGARRFPVFAPIRQDDVDHVKHDRHIYN